MLKIRIIKNLIIAIISLTIISTSLCAESVQTELQQRFGSEEVLKSHDELTRELGELYRARQFTPIWFHETGLSEAATNAIEAFEHAYQEGLEPEDYKLASRVVANYESDPTRSIDAEIALTKTALQY